MTTSNYMVFQDGDHSAVIEPMTKANSSAIYRIIGEDKSREVSFIVKFTSDYEAMIHSMVAKELGRAVPVIFGSIPLTSNHCLLIMEDVMDRHVDNEATLFQKGNAYGLIETVALLHSGFAGKTPELLRQGVKRIYRDDLSLPALKIADLLCACETLFNVQFSPGAVDLIRAAAKHFPDWSALIRSDKHTLVHGDLHQNNFLINKRGTVSIIDWASARLHIPQWDLILFDTESISFYIDCIRRLKQENINIDRFQKVLRAAKIVRFFDFLSVALKSIFTHHTEGCRFLLALPGYVEQLTGCLEQAD